MKTKGLLMIMLAIGCMSVSFGQDQKKAELQTLFGKEDHKISHGGYAAFSVEYTQVSGENVIMLGGRAGWLIDHHVTIGLAGKGFVSSIFIEDIPETDENGLYLSGGYGGFFVEPIIAPSYPIHISIPILIGGGGFVLNDHTWHYYNNYDYYEPYDWDSFFVFEPGVEIELNVVKFFRVAVGASYRVTSDLHIKYLDEGLMRGFNTGITFKFGKF